MDNDGQWSQPYPFTITIREVRRVFYVKDHLGNIRQSINETGTVVSAQDYYPYGEFISGRSYISVHPYEKYRFTEKERDIETGYDYFGSRYYDSQLGIWGQVDPMAGKYPGWSPYNYVKNNPMVYFDPNGKWRVRVEVNTDRTARIVLLKNDGSFVAEFYGLAKASSRNRYTSFQGDTPHGKYSIPNRRGAWRIPGENQSAIDKHKYGPNPRLVLNGIDGEIVETGRTYISLHGGDLNAKGELRITNGCMRLSNEDMLEFYNITQVLEAEDPSEAYGKYLEVYPTEDWDWWDLYKEKFKPYLDESVVEAEPDHTGTSSAEMQGYLDRMFVNQGY